MKVSVCIATFNKPRHLQRVLESILVQEPPFPFEVIVVDDGSPENGAENKRIAGDFAYEYIPREPVYRNPSKARNVAYRQAQGEYIICQSDDVMHSHPDAVERLVAPLETREDIFTVATVINTDWSGNPTPCLHPRNPKLVHLTGPQNPRPLFFLGALHRRHLCAIGGCEERFEAPGKDDVWFSECLMKGLGLSPSYRYDVVGWHLHHNRPAGIRKKCEPSNRLYQELQAEGRYVASGGPWPDTSRDTGVAPLSTP